MLLLSAMRVGNRDGTGQPRADRGAPVLAARLSDSRALSCLGWTDALVSRPAAATCWEGSGACAPPAGRGEGCRAQCHDTVRDAKAVDGGGPSAQTQADRWAESLVAVTVNGVVTLISSMVNGSSHDAVVGRDSNQLVAVTSRWLQI